MLQAFYNKTLTAGRVEVVGLGVDHARRTSYVRQMSLEKREGPQGEAKYNYRGEQRQDAAMGRKAIMPVAMKRPGANNLKEAIAGMTLQRIWGK